jgi:hypothetical protein
MKRHPPMIYALAFSLCSFAFIQQLVETVRQQRGLSETTREEALAMLLWVPFTQRVTHGRQPCNWQFGPAFSEPASEASTLDHRGAATMKPPAQMPFSYHGRIGERYCFKEIESGRWFWLRVHDAKEAQPSLIETEDGLVLLFGGTRYSYPEEASPSYQEPIASEVKR